MYEFVGANSTTVMEMVVALGVIVGFALWGRKMKKQKLSQKQPEKTQPDSSKD